MTTDLLPGDLNTLKYEAAYGVMSATCETLSAAIPGSSWRVGEFVAGHISGCVGCVEIELYLSDDGSWSATAHPAMHCPPGMDGFEVRSCGDEALELAHELLDDVWARLAA